MRVCRFYGPHVEWSFGERDDYEEDSEGKEGIDAGDYSRQKPSNTFFFGVGVLRSEVDWGARPVPFFMRHDIVYRALNGMGWSTFSDPW